MGLYYQPPDPNIGGQQPLTPEHLAPASGPTPTAPPRSRGPAWDAIWRAWEAIPPSGPYFDMDQPWQPPLIPILPTVAGSTPLPPRTVLVWISPDQSSPPQIRFLLGAPQPASPVLSPSLWWPVAPAWQPETFAPQGAPQPTPRPALPVWPVPDPAPQWQVKFLPGAPQPVAPTPPSASWWTAAQTPQFEVPAPQGPAPAGPVPPRALQPAWPADVQSAITVAYAPQQAAPAAGPVPPPRAITVWPTADQPATPAARVTLSGTAPQNPPVIGSPVPVAVLDAWLPLPPASQSSQIAPQGAAPPAFYLPPSRLAASWPAVDLILQPGLPAAPASPSRPPPAPSALPQPAADWAAPSRPLAVIGAPQPVPPPQPVSWPAADQRQPAAPPSPVAPSPPQFIPPSFRPTPTIEAAPIIFNRPGVTISGPVPQAPPLIRGLLDTSGAILLRWLPDPPQPPAGAITPQGLPFVYVPPRGAQDAILRSWEPLWPAQQLYARITISAPQPPAANVVSARVRVGRYSSVTAVTAFSSKTLVSQRTSRTTVS